MKRFALISVTALVALAATAAVAAPVAQGATLRLGFASSATHVAASVAALPRSVMAGFSCRRALVPGQRSMFVRAVMRPITGTQRMEMRFELLSKSSTTPGAVMLHGGGLGAWISPPIATLGQRAGDVWIVPDRVRDLPAPAVYHYVVSFRWIGAGGRVLSTRTRRSMDCFQPELRPDLLVSSIAVQAIPGKPAKDQYTAAIVNRGLTGAGPFQVSFTPGASASGGTPVAMTKTVQRLGAGVTRNVTFVGPACSALTAPTMVVNPGHTLGEYNYDNNSLTVAPTCPPLTSAPVSGPDLLVSSIAVEAIPGKPTKAQYVAAIENRGLVAAGSFGVRFTAASPAIGGPPVTITTTLQGLGADATQNVPFIGPACTAQTAPTVVVDPSHFVNEYDYANNSLTVDPTCPPLTSAPVPGP